MAQRYGGPKGAAAHEMAFHWYDRGGWLPPGLSLAMNGTGRPERVGGGGDIIINAPHYVGDKSDLVKAITDLRRQGRLR